jgi:hypothetical protein
MRRLIGFLVLLPILANAQVPKEEALAVFALLYNYTTPSPLSTDARDALIRNSAISTEAIQVVSDTVGQALELVNLDGDAARARKQANADFAGIESRRFEILQMLETLLKEKLGAEGWTRFDSFLQSMTRQMRVHRDLCDFRSTVYTFGIVLKTNSSMTAVAVAYGDYHSGESHLYAEATLRSPENREIVAKAPANSIRTYAAAAAPLEIGIEDGSYHGSFTFGEFCGNEGAPRLYTER